MIPKQRNIFFILFTLSISFVALAQNDNLISVLNDESAAENQILLPQILQVILEGNTSVPNSTHLELVTQRINFKRHFIKNNKSMLLPNGAYMTQYGIKPKLVLFIDKIEIKPVPGTPETNNQAIIFDYSIWDNEVLSLINFGTLSLKVASGNDSSSTNKQDHVEKIAGSLIMKWESILGQSKTAETPTKGFIGDPSDKPKRGTMVLVGLSGQYNGHLRDKEEGNPNIPDEYEDLSETPSVYNFYENSFSITPHVDLILFNKDFSFLLGYELNFETLNSNGTYLLSSESEEPSSDKLSITSHTFIVGFLKEFQPDNYWFIKGRIMNAHSEGEAKFSNVTITSKYQNAILPGLSIGFMAGKKVFLIGELGFNFGSINRTKITSGNSSQPADLKLSDNRFFLKAGIGFNAFSSQ